LSGGAARHWPPRPELLLARSVVAVLGVALAQEPGQLGCERVARRNVFLMLLEVELVRPLLEAGDVLGRLARLVAGDRLRDLLDVGLLGLGELRRVHGDVDQLAEPIAERAGGARARRERDVMGNGRPEARRRQPLLATRVLEHTDDPGRAFVARMLEPEAGHELRVAGRSGHGRRPGVRDVGEQRTERDEQLDLEVPREVDDELAERQPAQARLDAQQQDHIPVRFGDASVVEGILRPLDPPGQPLVERDVRAVRLEV
jgi:hypothetical protein